MTTIVTRMRFDVTFIRRLPVYIPKYKLRFTDVFIGLLHL